MYSTVMQRSLLICLLAIVSTTLSAQQYTKRQYKIENGLPSDLVKAIDQDSLGNLWIATDEGFVTYNAARFESYRKATHSQYTKGFFRTKSGRLLAFGDLDVFELDLTEDSIDFKSIVPVARSANDSSLTYPKLLYEDAQGSIWVSESQSVVRLDGKKIKRYEFSLEDRTPQFLRSFSFFEDGNGNLFTVSVAGNVFQYIRQQDKFEKSDYKFPSQIEFASLIDNRLIIGALTGLYIADKGSDGKFLQPRLVHSIPSVSYVARLPHGNYFVATRGSDHFLVDSTFTTKTLAVSDVNDINHVYVSAENDIWLSTNEGILLLQEPAFRGPVDQSKVFIECIVEDTRVPNKYYYATRGELHSLDISTGADKLILNNIKDSYFQSLVVTKNGVWAANAFTVILIKDGKITKTFDFSDQRMFVTLLNKDKDENIWLTIPGRKDILMIDTDLNLHTFQIPLGKDGFINNVTDGADGIYAVSNGADYLFHKAYTDTVFRNISVPFQLKTGEELNTFGSYVEGPIVWLATSVGLLQFDRETIHRVDIGEGYSGLPIRSINPNGNSGFVLTTPKEILYYNVQNDDGNLFASSMNLSGLTVNPRSIFIDHRKKVWIGTSRGVFISSRSLDEKVQTPQPQLAYANADRKRVAHFGKTVLPYNILLSLAVTSVTFPEEERIFQFRRSDEQAWTNLNGTSIDIITSSPGDQHIQVRARKTGPYDWSETTHLRFVVAHPFWMTPWFYLIIAIAIAMIILVTVLIVQGIEAKQKARLEAMVDKRTEELGEANRELEAFSYSVSHDLRAPLRSILAFSTMLEEDYGTKLDDEGRKSLSTVLRNANKMNQLIDDLLRFSRVLHQGLGKSTIDLNQMVKEIVDGLRETAYQNTTVNIQSLPTITADHGLIQQVWANLISNGMKYSSKAEKPQVDITYEEKGNEYIFRVKDNGAGFDMQYAEKLFGVFQRLHSDREFPGIGIGLALVRRIITRHDGRIWAEGKVGEGATFYFALRK
jgi:signal transduction histidine kinase/ligand-binding sensor domain-containing protein